MVEGSEILKKRNQNIATFRLDIVVVVVLFVLCSSDWDIFEGANMHKEYDHTFQSPDGHRTVHVSFLGAPKRNKMKSF